MGDQEFNLKFVGEVEKYKELYNFKLPEYSRKDVTEKAWQKVAAEVNLSAAECKEKWRNLRTVFMRKIKPPPSGSGAKRKAYYLEEAMQFCLPYVKTSAPPSSGNFPSIPLCCDENEVGNEDPPQDGLLEANLSQANLSPTMPCETPQLLPQDSNITTPTEILSTRAKSKKRSAAEADRSVAEYFKAKRKKINTIEQQISKKVDKHDSIKMFLLSLIPELEELNDFQIKTFKRRVFSIIDELSSSQNQPLLSTYQLVSPQSDISQVSQTSAQSQATEFYQNYSQQINQNNF